MAKEATTPNRKGSLSTRTREGVRNLFKEFKKDQRTIHVQSLNAMPAAERNSRLLQASTAMYRATKERNFKPSQEQIKDFAAACEIIAEKRGIATQKDGTYSKETLNNELSPMALMQVYAAQTLKDSGENDASRQQIMEDLKTGYNVKRSEIAGYTQPDGTIISADEYEKNQLPQEVQEVQQVPPSYADIMTDDDILDLNEEERNRIIAGMSPLDQDRLNKKLEDRKKAEDKAFDDSTGEARRRRDDPDWAKDDDSDNFKIEQGDIIEYLMKDIILASAAWAANKAAGLGGIVLYESASGIYKHTLRPAGQYAGKALSNQWNNFKALFGKKENENTEAKEILNDVIGNYEENIRRLNSDTEKTKETASHLKDYFKHIISNHVVFDETGDKIYGQFRDGWSETTFAEHFSDTTEASKKGLLDFRKNIRDEQLETLKKKFPDENIETWFDQQVKFEEDYVRTQGKPTIEEPRRLDPDDKYFNALTEIRASQKMQIELRKEAFMLDYKMNLFAAHYSTYKYIELCRQNPDNKILKNRDEVEAFLKNAHLEARQIFLTAEKKRRMGNPNIPSQETLIDEAKKMMETSRAQTNNKKPVKDKFRSILGEEQISEDNVKTLLSEYKNPDPAERYAAERFNCDALEREERLSEKGVTEKRKSFDEFAERCNKTLNKGKPDSEKIDIKKTYEIRKQSQGRH